MPIQFSQATEEKTAAPAKQKSPARQQQQPVPQPMASSNSSDQLMNNRFMSSLQALMGPPMAHQQQRSTSQKKHSAHQATKKDRLPSLHFGNLPEQFYDLDLFKFIKQSGHKVHKAFVVLDKKTQKNCDYGYAQFLTQAEATKCLAALNNATINGKVINVSQQATSKPNPKANVFVRNLPAKVTQSELFQIYSQHGQVTKCKLECYADGTSRGFAYVQFEDEKDATAAITATHDMDMQGKKLEVFAHEKKAAKNEGGPKSNNNVFVQGLPKGTDEAKLKDLFKEFGEISSAFVQNADSEDSMANNGFVCFNDTIDATSAIEKMNKKRLGEKGTFLLVCPHVAKRENDMSINKS